MNLSLYYHNSTVVATQIDKFNLIEVADWCSGEVIDGLRVQLFDGQKLKLAYANVGDWIVTDESTEFYIYSDMEFKATYTRYTVINPNDLNQAMKLAILMHREAPLDTYSGRTWQDMPIRHRSMQVEAARRILKALSEEDS